VLSSRAKRGIWVLACDATCPLLQAETKIPRFARDDSGEWDGRVPFQLLHLWVIRVLIYRRVFLKGVPGNESNFKHTKT
jgi:hypothetical protein